jgi:ribonuclease-3
VQRNIIDRIRLFFSTERESYLCFYRILGFYPRNIHLYEQALRHKSFLVSDNGKLPNNERLEFLGDAVLEVIVSDVVYKHFDGKNEGFLTSMRSKIVQRETLNKLAVILGLDKMIKMSACPSSHNNYLWGNAFEALIGAIYLDRGYNTCQSFVENKIIRAYFNLDKLSKKEVNFKSRLIEWGQKNRIEVVFRLQNQEQDAKGNPIFQSDVTLENIFAGSGKGYSKKESQQNAAKTALYQIKDEDFVGQVEEAKNQRLASETPDVDICLEEKSDEEVAVEE